MNQPSSFQGSIYLIYDGGVVFKGDIIIFSFAFVGCNSIEWFTSIA